MTDGLRAVHEVHLQFDRSVGGATGAFLAGLARREILGSRDATGAVTVPPRDGAELTPVGHSGSLRAWSWVADPEAGHPLPDPFAFALLDLDGSATALLHVVDVPDESVLRPGLRVRADWKRDRIGSILDIRAFVPEDAARTDDEDAPRTSSESVRVLDERRIRYLYEPGLAQSDFFRALAEGRIVGGRCPSCGDVYVPPHERCPACGSGRMTQVEVRDTGTVVSFTVVHLPTAGLDMEVPFGWARVLLDGADVPVPHVIAAADTPAIRVGARVEAVWADPGTRPSSWEAIRHFRLAAR